MLGLDSHTMFRLRERCYSENRVHFSGDWCDAVQRPRGTAKPSTEVVGAAGSTLIAQYTKWGKKRYPYPLNQEHDHSKR